MKKNITKGITKQDLNAQKTALKEAQKAVAEGIKTFRHDVAHLKRKGLLDKAYDARKVTPTKYLKSQIKKFGDVLRGEAQPVKISRKKIEYYKSQGYLTKASRVIVPVAKNEKAYPSHGDFRVKTSTPTGTITKIDTGLSRSSIQVWRQELVKRKIKLKDNERLSFQLFGNNAYMSFLNFNQMLEYLEHYPSYQEVDNSSNPDKQEQYVENVVIFKFERGAQLPKHEEANEIKQARLAKQAAMRREYVERMDPKRHEIYKRDRALAEQARREKKKKQLTPEQIETQKIKARERARKSYVRRVGDGKKDDSGN